MPKRLCSRAWPATARWRTNSGDEMKRSPSAPRRARSISPSGANSRWKRCRKSKSMVIIPLPETRPQRSAVAAVGRTPASCTASSAAARAKRENGVAYLRDFRSSTASSARSPLTSAAIRVGNPEASKPAISPIPDSPSRMAFQVDSTSLPSGVTMPIPVTATRLLAVIGSLQSSSKRSPGRRRRARRRPRSGT